MLVLTRKAGQSILIGKNVKIKILGVSGNQVELGIEAPKDVLILREELIERIKEFTKKSSERKITDTQIKNLKDMASLLKSSKED